MIVSHNEIITLVQKAFLSMNRECGEADLVANTVAELQMAGFGGIHHFNNASDYFLNEQDQPLSIIDSEAIENMAEPIKHNDSGNAPTHTIAFDCHGNSITYYLPAILDYALEQMATSPKLTLKLTNCHNRWLAYGELVKLAAKGIACSARWNNGSDPKHILFILNLGHSYPEVYFFDQTLREYHDTQNMTIELSTDNFILQEHNQGYVKHIGADNIIDLHQKSWQYGIEVDEKEWEKLKQTAARILVEESENSMRGAGGI
ncbi:DUF3726 domain-containing protein [Neisseria montereyensis]|uniref:DUF3726 domain-containing protein n=1 Tax=Neisseria montereyensis TaxID=2973938 RepID=A0ABT2FAI8_9NEIS|nr:DUF3726 domain-containing protein [Neisseria montereyensis]MCS4533239.1 DUF3726 domain-containing protein [Neisseria montereyensis]